jgi:hypothetical protein
MDEHNHLTTPHPVGGPDAAREQVERILASNTFHASEVLRRLLKFLADKTFSGAADELKEYSIGLDALGKPPSYDPRQDAAVRLHVSRLRQKLDHYYREEGTNDPLVIELPKGRFKIGWRVRSTETGPVPTSFQPVAVEQPARHSSPIAPPRKMWRTVTMASLAFALGLLTATVWSLVRPSRGTAANRETAPQAPELDALWSPFLNSRRHLILAFVNPLFVRLQRKGAPDIVYRTSGNHTWEEAVSSPEFSVLKQSLETVTATPTFNLVERSNLISTFVLSEFFARRRADIFLARSDEVSWQQLADNDVILFGKFANDGEQSALPVKPLLAVDRNGVRNLQPLPGEPPTFADPPSHSPTDGEALELVSMMPGPLGRTTVETFSSNNKWGVIGGTQSLTDPAFARVIERKLRKADGKIPPYYQLLLKIKYRDGTVTHVSYVTHRVVTMTSISTEGNTPK